LKFGAVIDHCVQVLKAKFMRLNCHGSVQAAGNSPGPSLSPPLERSGNQTIAL